MTMTGRVKTCRLTPAAFLAAGLALGGTMAAFAEPPSPPRYEPLSGRAVGVLVWDARSALAAEGRAGPADAVCFSSGAGSLRWVYLPTPGDAAAEPLTLATGPEGKVSRTFPAVRLADAALAKRLALPAPYCLAEVEVNGGAGGPAEESFVATRIKVLDGMADYPLRVSEVVSALRARYEREAGARRGAVDAELARLTKTALGGRPLTGPREETLTVAVTWLPGSERLRLGFRTEVTDGVFGRGQGAGGGPPRPGERTGTQIGVRFGTVYEVPRTGLPAQGAETVLEPFVRELAPPPGSPRPAGGIRRPRGAAG